MIKTFAVLLLLVLITAGGYAAYRIADKPYEVEIEITSVPTFTPVPLEFNHEFRREFSLPFMGSAIIDIDNNGRPEIFLGGGHRQRDALFKYSDGQFQDISTGIGLGKEPGDATYGAATVDLNRDGFTDLLVARDSGLYLYFNRNGFFTGGKLPVTFDSTTVPLSIAVGDINRDGYADLFISCFLKPEYLRRQIFNDPKYGTQSMLLLNNGNNTFTDITVSAGLEYLHNAFTALFADLDNDGLPDLVVAHNTAHVRTYRNLGNNRFEKKHNPTMDYFSFPTGLAAGDFNNDGLVDLFISNIGSTIPAFLARGDLREDQQLHTKWTLLRNDGGFKFTDVAPQYLLADYEFGWGAAFADFNLDGLKDLVVTGNYVNFLPQQLYRNPGKFFIQKDNMTFAPAERTAGVINREFGISPLVADFNNDGYPDLVLANLNSPSKAFINHGGNAKFLKVDLGDIPEAVGAQITLTTNTGQRYTRQVIPGQGLAADQTHIVTFGLGRQTGIEAVEVRYPSGRILLIDKPALNSTLDLKPAPETVIDDITAALPDLFLRAAETPAAPTPTELPDFETVTPESKPDMPKLSTEDELQRLLSE